jgi:hypothetical protein
MAVTKTHSIKSTLRKALDYILNPDKTDAAVLVSSFACSPETADIEFEMTRGMSEKRGTNLARHLIQSFAPGETTPEQAHEIGMKLAEEILGGKYEFVLSTHIDKGHVHNHLIFNSVSFVDYKKYHSNKRTYYFIRRTSDRLCREYGLSVVEPNNNRGKSYTEYTSEKNGTSWKAKLKVMIDTLIPQAKNFDELLRLMEQNGYEIKRGQYISVRAAGQTRFTRLKAETLGERYTPEAISDRIKGRNRKSPQRDNNNRISLIIDIQNCIKAQQSKGYEHWAKINNLKQASKTLNFLTEHGITSYDELENKIAELHSKFDDTAGKLKAVEKRLTDTNILRKHIKTYQALRPVYAGLKTAKNKSQYEKMHKSELILYEASYKYLSEVQTNGKLPTLENVNTDYMELTEQKNKLYQDYRKEKKAVSDMDIIKSNVDMILDIPKKQEPSKDKENSI